MVTSPPQFSAKIVSLDPPLVSTGRQRYPAENLSGVAMGDWVRVTVTASGTARVETLELRSACPFPGDEWARFQFPLFGPTRMDALHFRGRLQREVRTYFWDLGHWEVETPVRVPSPGVETHLVAIGSDGWYLSPSPEFQMKRLLAGGSGSIFQIQKCFRGAERGARHNPEFTMLEWYSVGASGEDLRRETEGLIEHLSARLDRHPLPPAPYARLTMAQAFAEFAGIDNYRLDPDTLYEKSGMTALIGCGHTWEEAFFTVLAEVCEPRFADVGPLFLTEWPIEFASLSRPVPGDPTVADRFELYANGLELANGFVELTDHKAQRSRSLDELEQRRREGKPHYPLDEKFLLALQEGMPDTAGIALGLDRLAMLFWGSDDINTLLTFAEHEL